MKKTTWLEAAWVLAVLAATVVGLPSTAFAQQTPAQLFAVCSACHTVGGGTRVGPDLAGVNDRRTTEWLIAFIRSPQARVAAGDPVATQLLAQFNRTMMPDQNLTDDQIRGILDYIRAGGPSTTAYSRAIGPGDVQRGQDIYQGIIRLENGGAPCNSCHNVRNDAVIGGGVLAKDLTNVFSRMGGNGVGQILGTPPFPVMERAYADHPLTADEIHAMVAFLQKADADGAFQRPRDYGVLLVASGTGMFLGLLVLYGLIWMRRKTRSVNQAIYDRQLRSS